MLIMALSLSLIPGCTGDAGKREPATIRMPE